ncbi:MAG: PilZ domain-containing protein [Thermodesulfobacteriota bacterium]
MMASDKTLEQEVLQDLYSGMDDTALMKKYRMSYGELRSLYKQLFDSGLLTRAHTLCRPSAKSSRESEGRSPLQSTGRSPSELPGPIVDEKRADARRGVSMEIPAYDRDQPETHGYIRDISERGAQLRGVEVDVGETKTIVTLGDMSGEVAPFEFEARCCWTETEPQQDQVVAGFEIVQITEENRYELKKLMDVLEWSA